LKAAAEEELGTYLEKASMYMNNVRSKDGGQWDGVRVETRHTVERLEQKVRHHFGFVYKVTHPSFVGCSCSTHRS